MNAHCFQLNNKLAWNGYGDNGCEQYVPFQFPNVLKGELNDCGLSMDKWFIDNFGALEI